MGTGTYEYVSRCLRSFDCGGGHRVSARAWLHKLNPPKQTTNKHATNTMQTQSRLLICTDFSASSPWCQSPQVLEAQLSRVFGVCEVYPSKLLSWKDCVPHPLPQQVKGVDKQQLTALMRHYENRAGRY